MSAATTNAGGLPRPRLDDFAFVHRAAIFVAMLFLVALVIRLSDVLLLGFGAILAAVVLHALAEPIARFGRLNQAIALTLAMLLTTGLIVLSAWLFGWEAMRQLQTLSDLVPAAWRGLQADLGRSPLGALLLADLHRLEDGGGLIAWLGPLARSAVSGVAGAIIALFAGLYLAFHPATYQQGFLSLLPRPARAEAARVLDACGLALRRWLAGQVISMVLVGLTTGLGLWIIGAPAPLGLGLLAGAGQFVPVVGPAAAMAVGLLVSLSEGPTTFAWAAVIYVCAMQVEANVITPLVLRQMVELPMAVTLFAVLAMGVLLGPMGVLFATPLAVIAHVLVRILYVERLLGDALASPATEVRP
ncbi:AI-2E family transporter [Phenylobacterium sp. J367]|uniref:AI-2E family transporter n=1 Tax=Phenylobacterium sp. J367 TaxID=2898435 RepID=UPI002151549F|nr:AI-2E family transporter [Phenylobacterium sp. J367]MCR5879277.1 AI-2E family transporter [Phenylobacterium sp. J367]